MCIIAPQSSAFLQADATERLCKDAHMPDPDLEAARRVIFAIMQETGLDATQLARRAGLAHTTLTRPLYDPTWKHVPSTRTMNKVMNVAARLRLMTPPPAPPPRPKRARKKVNQTLALKASKKGLR